MAGWRDRAVPVTPGLDLQNYNPNKGYPVNGPTMPILPYADDIGVADIAQPVSDWRSRAQPVEKVVAEKTPELKVTVNPKKKNFFERVGENFAERQGQLDEGIAAYNQGNQSLPETALQALGKYGAGGVLDTLGEIGVSGLRGLSAITPDAIEDPAKRMAGEAFSSIAQSPVGQAVGSGIGSAIGAYGQFAESNPRAARNIESVANLGALFTPVKGNSLATKSTELAGKGAKAVASPVAAPVKFARNAVNPSISEEGAKIIELGKKYVVPIGLDDVTDDINYKTMISEGKTLPGYDPAPSREQRDKFIQAVSRETGLDTSKMTPEVVKERFETVGKEIGDFLKGKKINVGNDFGGKINEFIADNSDSYIGDSKKQFFKYIKDIQSVVDRGGMALGDDLEKIRKRAVVAKRSKNAEVSQLGNQIENFILDAAQGAEGIDRAALDAFKNSKYQYKNLIVLEPLLQRDQIAGGFSPAQLLGRVRQVYGRSFTKGDAGAMGDLANLGQYIKDDIPNSGTSQRQSVRKVLTGDIKGLLPTAGALSLVNPLAGIAALGLQGLSTGGGYLLNKSLQRGNFSPDKLEKALKNFEKNQIPVKLEIKKKEIPVVKEERNIPQLLLPAPQKEIIVSPSGKARTQTLDELSQSALARKRASDLGMTPDISRVVLRREIREKVGSVFDEINEQQKTKIENEINKAFASQKIPISEIIKNAKEQAQELSRETRGLYKLGTFSSALEEAKPLRITVRPRRKTK